MISILLLGFVIGMRHAFEADHLAALSALVSSGRSVRSIAPQGAVWGAGHTLALVVLSGAVLLTPSKLPAGFAPALEAVVGGVLVVLGANLLFRLWRDRVHVHAHRHADGVVHLHAHSHRDDPAPHDPGFHEATPHDRMAHEHEHPARLRTLLVGVTHGAAGSAALTVYVAASLDSPWTGLFYVICFGAGSILGMAVLSSAIAWPLTALASSVTWMHRSLQVAAGTFSIGVGLHLAATQLGSLF